MHAASAPRRVLITGSTRGIGLSMASAFVSNGDRVFINGRDAASLAAAISSLGENTKGFAADVTQASQARELTSACVSELGGVDILVCNVGSGSSVEPGSETAAEWAKSIALNLFSASNMVEAAQAELVKSAGSILCISSICGVECIPGAPVTYSAAKAALNAFVRGISRPLGKSGVRINAIAPGNILFDGSVWSRRMLADPGAVREMLCENVALGTLGKPDDVAQLALYLSSASARFATGSVWTLDGGQIRAF